MDVFILFAGGMTPLQVSPVAGEEKLDLIPIGRVPQDVRDAFHSAMLAMYRAVKKKGISIQYTLFAYRLDPDVADRIHGGSGALAFAISVMYSMLGQQVPRDIGATGVIHDIHDGRVSKVDALREKLQYAIEHLEGGVLFYPQANENEISPDDPIRQAARAKGVDLYPIQDLYDVLNHLLPVAKKARFVPTLISCMVLILLLLLYGSMSHNLAVFWLERGRYTLVRWHLNAARYIAFWNSDLRAIDHAFRSPLNAEVVLRVLFARGREEDYRTDKIPYTLSLSDQDIFAFRIYPLTAVYVYIYQFDKDNAVKRLYPSDPADLSFSKTTALPGKGVWFNLISPAGKVMLAVLLTRWRCRDLEEPLSPEALIQRLAVRDAPAIPALLHRVQFNQKR